MMWANDWNAIAADSRSYPDFLLVAKLCRVLRISSFLDRPTIQPLVEGTETVNRR